MEKKKPSDFKHSTSDQIHDQSFIQEIEPLQPYCGTQDLQTENFEYFQPNIQKFQTKSKRKQINVALPQDVKKKPKNKNKSKRKQKKQDQINFRDIIDIIIIILLVIILGVSLFRVILQVQVQYRRAEDLKKGNFRKNSFDKELTDYERINKVKNQNIISESLLQQTQPAENYNKSPTLTNTKTPLPQISAECQAHINNILQEKGGLYDFRVTHDQFKVKSQVQFFMQGKNNLIKKQQYSQAIQLLGIVHQVSMDGELKIQDSPCETMQNKRKRLENLIRQHENRLNEKYQMHKFITRQLRFCLVVNSYNNAKNGLIYRNIDSILQQDYQNYHVVYTDDHSTDQTGQKVKQYLIDKNVPQGKFKLIVNSQKVGMMQNIYQAVYNSCKQGQIVVMLDGDDALIGTKVLPLLNAVYQKYKPAVMWSNFLQIFSNSQANIGFSRDYTQKNKKQANFRKIKSFISSHLKTFFVDVFKKIKTEDLKTEDGKFYGGASDTAMMIPMIEMANPKIKYLPEILYEYRYDTGQTGNFINKVPQKEALKKIFSLQPYQRLKDFSFIDRAIENAVEVS